MIYYLIQIASACNLLTDQLEIYPTVNELLILPLLGLFNDNFLNYSCAVNCPENVTIFNVMNHLSFQQLDYTTQIMSSNSTHFATVGNNYSFVYLYKYNETNYELILYNSVQKAPGQLCFGLLFTFTNNLLLDCYDQAEKQLYFYCLNKSTFGALQIFSNQSKPFSTKMKNFQKGQESFMLYAQSYKTYSLLTLFQQKNDSLINLTTWSDGVEDFDVSNQYIYIIGGTQNLIYQVTINQSYEFVTLFEYQTNLSLIQIQVTKFYFFDYQCDFLAVHNYIQNSLNIIFFQAWNRSIIYRTERQFLEFNGQATQMRFSEEFFIIYEEKIGLLSIVKIENLLFRNQYYDSIQQYGQIYLDPRSSDLFIFSDVINVYNLKIPQIQIKYSKEETEQQKFKLIGSKIQDSRKDFLVCNLEVFITVISKDDKNVYVNYNVTNTFLYSLLFNDLEYYIIYVAGPLLETTGIIEDPSIGIFIDVTVHTEKVFDIDFSVTNMLYIPNYFFFSGATAEGIYFYLGFGAEDCDQIHNESNITEMTQIQIQYNFQGLFLVGIDQGVFNIAIYTLNVTQEGENIQKQIFSFPSYKQFFLMYDNIVLLLLNNEIQIQSLFSSDNFNINGQVLKTLFPCQFGEQFEFTPINIEMNQADQSSILYINNNNSFIIVLIEDTNVIIPFSFVNVNYSIYQLNIINDLLILSYICDQQICFDVWNVLNLLNPYYVNSLPNILVIDEWSIQSDQLFLYVLAQNQTVFVFNPLLSYHSSLYYEFQIIGNQFSSLSMGDYSLISYCNLIQKLSAIRIQQLQYNYSNYILLEQKYITQNYCNFSVSNKYSISTLTQSPILTLINTYTNFQEYELNFNFTPSENYQIFYIPQYAQILNYDSKYQDICAVQNYIQVYEPQTSSSISNKTQLIILDQTLLLQNGLEFIPLNVTIEGNNNINFSEFPNKNLSNPFNLSSVNEPQCNTSFINEKLVTQMCMISINNTQQLHLIQFEFACINFSCCYITEKFDYVPLYPFFQQITKLVSINKDQQVVLGSLNGLLSQLYQISTSSNNSFYEYIYLAYCQTGIVDFATLEFKDQLILFYICENKLLYKSFTNELQKIHTKILIDIQKFDHAEQFSLVSVTVSKKIIRVNYVKLLLTTKSSLSFIYLIHFVTQNDLQIIFYPNIVKTIPPYLYLEKVWEQNGHIMIRYFDSTYALYDWTNMNDSLDQPLLMNGGFQYYNLLNSIAFNLTEKGGQIYEIFDGQKLYGQNLFTQAYLNCTLKAEQNYSITLFPNNNLGSNEPIPVHFTYVVNRINIQQYIGVMIFVAIVFLIAVFFFWYKTQDVIENESLLEEIEMNE